MNRRDFLKALGLTPIAVVLPTPRVVEMVPRFDDSYIVRQNGDFPKSFPGEQWYVFRVSKPCVFCGCASPWLGGKDCDHKDFTYHRPIVLSCPPDDLPFRDKWPAVMLQHAGLEGMEVCMPEVGVRKR
jgi:hypothetical protein